MKIQDRSISPVEAVQRREAKPTIDGAKKASAAKDASVTLSATAVALSDNDPVRSKYVQDLKAAFERGDTIVDHARTAEAMLDAEE